MRTVLLALLLGGCRSSGDSTAVLERTAANTPKPPFPQIRLCLAIYGPKPASECGASPPPKPVEHYQRAQTVLKQTCGSDAACPSKSTIAIWAVLDVQLSDTAAWEALFKAYGFKRLYDEAITQNKALIAAAQPAMRALDLKRSLEHITDDLLQKIWVDQLIAPYQARYNTAVLGIRDKTTADLNTKATAKLGPEMTKLAAQRVLLKHYKAQVDQYVSEVEGRRARFDALVDSFAVYRSSELRDFAFLKDYIERASVADLQGMLPLQKELVDRARDLSTAPEGLRGDLNKMRHELARIQQVLDAFTDKYMGELQAAGFSVADKTASSIQSLLKMESYIEDRARRVQQAVDDTLEGVLRRKQALMLVAADDLTKKTITDVANARTETAFLDEANNRVAILWTAPPKSTKLKLPYYEDVVSRATAFISLTAVCADPMPWMKPGCDVYQRNTLKARTYLTDSIPFAIERSVGKLRKAGVADAILTTIETAIAANDVPKAADLYDAAVRTTE